MLTIMICILSFISCKRQENNTIEQKKDSSENALSELATVITQKSDKNISCDLVLEFLYEYEKNYDKIFERDFINYEGNYSVNFDNLKYYIDKTQLQKFCTQNYINNFRNVIVNIDAKLKAQPQNDGTIDGLESDYILHTQELEEVLNYIRDRKINCIEKTGNIVQVNFENIHSLIFRLDKDKIDSIELMIAN